MKKILTIILFVLSTLCVQAQGSSHEYLIAQFGGAIGKMSIIYSNVEPESFDFRTVDKTDDKVWMKLALQKIQKLESEGWEVQDVELNGALFVWIMRKPKQ